MGSCQTKQKAETVRVNMGASASQPTNKVGKKVANQKIETAQKTGVLSLREHKLDEVPSGVFQLSNLRTLDLSNNSLTALDPRLAQLSNLKSLNCDNNRLQAGSLAPVSSLTALQTLSAGGNRLGKHVKMENPSRPQPEAMPSLPETLKQLKLDKNHFSSLPPQICNPSLVKLEKLDLSFNLLATIPSEIGCLAALVDLNLDSNSIVSLPEEVGKLKKLKALSLRNNQIRVDSTVFSEKNPQPIPSTLFTDTPLIDLNLDGNKMTNTQLNEFDGFHAFLERRTKIKNKNVYGGALTDLNVCGLE